MELLSLMCLGVRLFHGCCPPKVLLVSPSLLVTFSHAIFLCISYVSWLTPVSLCAVCACCVFCGPAMFTFARTFVGGLAGPQKIVCVVLSAVPP